MASFYVLYVTMWVAGIFGDRQVTSTTDVLVVVGVVVLTLAAGAGTHWMIDRLEYVLAETTAHYGPGPDPSLTLKARPLWHIAIIGVASFMLFSAMLTVWAAADWWLREEALRLPPYDGMAALVFAIGNMVAMLDRMRPIHQMTDGKRIILRVDAERIYLGAQGIRLPWGRITRVAVADNPETNETEITVTHQRALHPQQPLTDVQPIVRSDRELVRDAIVHLSPLVEVQTEPWLFQRA